MWMTIRSCLIRSSTSSDLMEPTQSLHLAVVLQFLLNIQILPTSQPKPPSSRIRICARRCIVLESPSIVSVRFLGVIFKSLSLVTPSFPVPISMRFTVLPRPPKIRRTEQNSIILFGTNPPALRRFTWPIRNGSRRLAVFPSKILGHGVHIWIQGSPSTQVSTSL